MLKNVHICSKFSVECEASHKKYCNSRIFNACRFKYGELAPIGRFYI